MVTSMQGSPKQLNQGSKESRANALAEGLCTFQIISCNGHHIRQNQGDAEQRLLVSQTSFSVQRENE